MSDKQWELQPENKELDKNEEAIKGLLSSEFRKAAFQLSLMADDEVVRAYSDLMQYTFRMADNSQQPVEGENQPNEILNLLAAFLLSIRKSIGNKDTDIDAIGMVDWFASKMVPVVRDEYHSIAISNTEPEIRGKIWIPPPMGTGTASFIHTRTTRSTQQTCR